MCWVWRNWQADWLGIFVFFIAAFFFSIQITIYINIISHQFFLHPLSLNFVYKLPRRFFPPSIGVLLLMKIVLQLSHSIPPHELNSGIFLILTTTIITPRTTLLITFPTWYFAINSLLNAFSTISLHHPHFPHMLSFISIASVVLILPPCCHVTSWLVWNQILLTISNIFWICLQLRMVQSVYRVQNGIFLCLLFVVSQFFV